MGILVLFSHLERKWFVTLNEIASAKIPEVGEAFNPVRTQGSD